MPATARPRCRISSFSTKGRSACWGRTIWCPRNTPTCRRTSRSGFEDTSGWLGFTDKYWATAVVAKPGEEINALFSWRDSQGFDEYQTSFVETKPLTVAAGATASNDSYVFAGAKEEAVIASYEKQYGFDRLELLIDWGWFHFFTKPLFYFLRFLYGILGNFGLAILCVTIIVKAVFFPLASRSYASMASMRRVQPEMKAIQERHKDDRAAQQQAMMELYKREKINPLSGCWPMLIQIPVFFSLYTVHLHRLEMRHAPFFGWIQDLAAPDPTNVFTLFGLIPWDPTAVPIFGALPRAGRLAADHGHHHVGADEAEPAPARPDPGDDLQLDADHLHLHARHLPGGPGDLLGLEQHAVDHPAIHHHAAPWRQAGLFWAILRRASARKPAQNRANRWIPKTGRSMQIEAGRLLFARPFVFIKGCVRVDDLPPSDRVEVAFAGRSNVGKSSLINALVEMRALARTSNTPGRTQELNIFEAEQAPLRIVDMPGYGFAQAPKPKVAAWNKLIHSYLIGRPNLRRVYVLIDGRHGPKANDLTVMNELDSAAVSYRCVLTKADKPPAKELEKAIEATRKAIAKRPAAHPNLIVTSSQKGEGIPELRAEIAAFV